MTVTQFVKKYQSKFSIKEIVFRLSLSTAFFKSFDNRGFISLEGENISPSNIGTIVDHLTRFFLTRDINQCLEIINRGFESFEEFLKITPANKFPINKYFESHEECKQQYFLDSKTLKKIKKELGDCIDLTDSIVIKMCHLVKYNNFYRGGINAFARSSTPNRTTIENIKLMVSRSVIFLKNFQNLIPTAVFEQKAFNTCKLIDDGDGDFRTDKYLIEMKTKNSEKIQTADIYQCIIYFLLYQNQGINLENIFIINPRYGAYYEWSTSLIPQELIESIRSIW